MKRGTLLFPPAQLNPEARCSASYKSQSPIQIIAVNSNIQFYHRTMYSMYKRSTLLLSHTLSTFSQLLCEKA